MDRLINITNQQASTSHLKIDETKLVNFIPKTLVWNHFNVWRENFIASSRDKKSNMMQIQMQIYRVKNAD